MYNIPHFKANDRQEVLAFMHAHPFVTLCGAGGNGLPVATHVPVLIEERGDKIFLLAHVMRKQDHTKAFEKNPNVLVIFYGAHTYVSASWYENKRTAGTWNYQAVHARGQLRFTGEEELHRLLTRLTEKFENDPHSSALVQHMDKEYVTNMMKAIVAFEIEITAIEHVFKLSQNRDAKSYENIMEQLNTLDDDAKKIASAMRARMSKH